MPSMNQICIELRTIKREFALETMLMYNFKNGFPNS